MDVQIYSAPPRSASLPTARSLINITARASCSMPNQTQARNMTGIYLGLEGNVKPPRAKSCVSLHGRSRGPSIARTSMEEHRYDVAVEESSNVSVPERKVEKLRIKENNRGFSGQPLKQRNQHTSVRNQRTSVRNQRTPLSSQPVPANSTAVNEPASPVASPGGSTHVQPQATRGRSRSPTVKIHQPALARRWGPGKLLDPNNLDVMIRPNSRNYTTVSNSGVTRSERLTGVQGGHSQTGRAQECPQLIERFSPEELDELEECFRKVCKGNIQLLSLLPIRKPHYVQFDSTDTGFTVRSYRKPKEAEILAQFPSVHNSAIRSKTSQSQRPLVPQPYFFRSGLSSAAAPSPSHPTSRSPVYHLPDPNDNTSDTYQTSSTILPSSGAGSISRSLQRAVQSPPGLISAAELLTATPAPQKVDPQDPHLRSLESTASTSRLSSHSIQDIPPITPPPGESKLHVTSLADILFDPTDIIDPITTPQSVHSDASDTEMYCDDSSAIEGPVSEVKIYGEEENPVESQRIRPKLTASNSGADIMLGLETDEGQSAEVEIDAADQEELLPEAEAPKGRVRKASITEKVIKSKASEAMAALIKEEAETRQREFEKLLDEHAELVQEISRTPSSENLIQGQRDH